MRFNFRRGFNQKSKSIVENTYVKSFKGNQFVAQKRRFSQVIPVMLVVLVLIGISVFIVTPGLRLVNGLRSGSNNGPQVDLSREVIGLKSIPIYPGSKFIYDGDETNTLVKQFLSLGKSIYAVGDDSTSVDIYQFYKDNMPKLNWQLVNDVPTSDITKLAGLYWSKDSLAVRIHCEANDIWYETVDLKDAQEGMATQVLVEKAESQLIFTSDTNKLPPDYPWKFTVPDNYTMHISVTDIVELKAIDFTNTATGDVVTVTPIGLKDKKTSRELFQDFLDNLNQSLDSIKWEITSTVNTTFNGESAWRFGISTSAQDGEAYIIRNPRDNCYYAIITYKLGEPIYVHITTTIEVLPIGKAY